MSTHARRSSLTIAGRPAEQGADPPSCFLSIKATSGSRALIFVQYGNSAPLSCQVARQIAAIVVPKLPR